jgi:hypothetical protein
VSSGGIIGAVVGAAIPILLMLGSIRDEVRAIRKQLADKEPQT